MTTRKFIPVAIAAALFPGARIIFAQNSWQDQVFSLLTARVSTNIIADQEPALSEWAWRCSLDGKAYAVNISETLVRIRPVRSGTILADIRLQTDKRGRSKAEGQWQAGSYHGLLVIQELTDGHVGGHMLVPAVGADAGVCSSRTSAILGALAGMSQKQVPCTAAAVSWDRQSAITIQQAAAEEGIHVDAAAEGGVPPSGNGAELVGQWEQRNGDRYNPKEIWLTLKADGTYEKLVDARLFGAGHIATIEKGTWTARGTLVHLSGDKDYGPSTIDLRSFSRTR